MESSVTHRHFRPYPHDYLLARTILPYVPHWVTPNQITTARILLTPLCAWVIWRGWYGYGIALFLMLGASDALDGSLARIRKQVTTWGMVADPVADKLLIASIALILLFRDFPEELIVAIVGIEAIFIAGGFYWHRRGQVVSANGWGKAKMVMQVLGITLFLGFQETGVAALALGSYGVLGFAVILAIISLWTQGA